jgi:hypothetical protein
MAKKTRSARRELLKKHTDPKLRFRLYLFFTLALVMLGILAYEIIQTTLSLTLAFIGFAIGLFVGFAAGRMFDIKWHEETSRVVSRMDKLGAIVLIAYITFAILRSWIFGHWLQGTALMAFTFSILAGVMSGRLISMQQSIKKILLNQGILN